LVWTLKNGVPHSGSYVPRYFWDPEFRLLVLNPKAPCGCYAPVMMGDEWPRVVICIPRALQRLVQPMKMTTSQIYNNEPVIVGLSCLERQLKNLKLRGRVMTYDNLQRKQASISLQPVMGCFDTLADNVHGFAYDPKQLAKNKSDWHGCCGCSDAMG